LQAFFTTRLAGQRHASANTVATYRDAWRLLLRYAHDSTGKKPCQMDAAAGPLPGLRADSCAAAGDVPGPAG